MKESFVKMKTLCIEMCDKKREKEAHTQNEQK